MSKICSWGHITAQLGVDDKVLKQFGKDLADRIEQMQNNNLEVEIQYQQSNDYCSVLILGRERNSK